MTDTLRDRIAAVLVTRHSDINVYDQADTVIDVLNQWDVERSDAGDSAWDEAVARVQTEFPHWLIQAIPRLSTPVLRDVEDRAHEVLLDRYESGALE